MQPFCKTKVLVLFLFMHIQTTDDQYTFNESLHLIFWCIQIYLIYDLFISFNILCFTIINRK